MSTLPSSHQTSLQIRLGQYSAAGRKESNQDFHGAAVPEGYLAQQKGIACAIADGISSSNVSHIASETAVSSFLADYFSTPDSWSVKTSVDRVIRATNSWLYAQTQQSQGRVDKDRGYVCTFSALVFKHETVHLFHIGDARIYRLREQQLEQLSVDHRVWLSSRESYLSRALGVAQKVEVDYLSLPLAQDDIFLLMTDGVYEYLSDSQIIEALHSPETLDLDQVAEMLVNLADAQGSPDNLTLQIVQVQQLPQQAQSQFQPSRNQLSLAPDLSIGQQFEGYRIQNVLHQNHRSRLYLAWDEARQQQLVIKIPSLDLTQNAQALERFLLEEWVAKRIQHPQVLAAYPHQRSKSYYFQTYEYLSGQTLNTWLHQQRQPIALETAIQITEQIIKGLQAFHRLDMLHQDIRPENIMLNAQLELKLIDFGATLVKGISESQPQHAAALGTLAFMAPEYFCSRPVSTRSDQFSLAVVLYYVLSKQLPYGTELARCQTLKQLKTVRYHSILEYRPDIPVWIDGALHKALALMPNERYEVLSEFLYDLKHPNRYFLKPVHSSLLDKNPVRFWQAVSAMLFLCLLLSLALRFSV